MMKRTCHVNNWNRYKFVKIANITIKRISNDENDFRTRTSIFATRGQWRCNSKPIPSGMIKPTANDAMRTYGIIKLPRSKMTRPSVKIHSGIIPASTWKKLCGKIVGWWAKNLVLHSPNAENVLMVVIAIDKSRFPPKITHQIFEAPPDGDTPVKNIPSCISTLFGKSSTPNE